MISDADIIFTHDWQFLIFFSLWGYRCCEKELVPKSTVLLCACLSQFYWLYITGRALTLQILSFGLSDYNVFVGWLILVGFLSPTSCLFSSSSVVGNKQVTDEVPWLSVTHSSKASGSTTVQARIHLCFFLPPADNSWNRPWKTFMYSYTEINRVRLTSV